MNKHRKEMIPEGHQPMTWYIDDNGNKYFYLFDGSIHPEVLDETAAPDGILK